MTKLNRTQINAMSLEDQLAHYKAENARLTATGGRRLTIKMGEKGGVCVYGLMKFPVTLYREQWQALKAFFPEIEAFILDNKETLDLTAAKNEERKAEEKRAKGHTIPRSQAPQAMTLVAQDHTEAAPQRVILRKAQ